MSLILRKTSNWWYGYFRIDGNEEVVPLGIRVEGIRPPTLRNTGDALFEQSRGAAKLKHDEIEQELRDKRNLSHLTERLIEIKTGAEDSSGYVALAELPERWMETRHKRGKNSKYVQECKTILRRFVAYLQEKHPGVKELLLVTGPMARAFMKVEETRQIIRKSRRVGEKDKPIRNSVCSVTSRTWNNTFKLLKGAFRYLAPESPAYKDYFCKTELKEEDVIHRQPYTPDDLKAILDAAQKDDFTRPIIVTGICTAMRRGDCCRLRWSDVKFNTGFVHVQTAKTKKKVWIPMFDLLRQEFEKRKKGKSEFVFPDQAELYNRNPDEITARVQSILEKAGFKDGDDTSEVDPEQPGRGELHQQREAVVRKASVRGFHSFRVTWITLALTAGVPIELVRKVTGHESVEIVLKNYFQPNDEHFRAILQTALPSLIVGQVTSRDEQMRQILEKSSLSTWEKDRESLLEMLKPIGRSQFSQKSSVDGGV